MKLLITFLIAIAAFSSIWAEDAHGAKKKKKSLISTDIVKAPPFNDEGPGPRPRPRPGRPGR